jgi:hypothetical protein
MDALSISIKYYTMPSVSGSPVLLARLGPETAILSLRKIPLNLKNPSNYP